jgi:hypothetical protein
MLGQPKPMHQLAADRRADPGRQRHHRGERAERPAPPCAGSSVRSSATVAGTIAAPPAAISTAGHREHGSARRRCRAPPPPPRACPSARTGRWPDRSPSLPARALQHDRSHEIARDHRLRHTFRRTVRTRGRSPAGPRAIMVELSGISEEASSAAPSPLPEGSRPRAGRPGSPTGDRPPLQQATPRRRGRRTRCRGPACRRPASQASREGVQRGELRVVQAGRARPASTRSPLDPAGPARTATSFCPVARLQHPAPVIEPVPVRERRGRRRPPRPGPQLASITRSRGAGDGVAGEQHHRRPRRARAPGSTTPIRDGPSPSCAGRHGPRARRRRRARAGLRRRRRPLAHPEHRAVAPAKLRTAESSRRRWTGRRGGAAAPHTGASADDPDRARTTASDGVDGQRDARRHRQPARAAVPSATALPPNASDRWLRESGKGPHPATAPRRSSRRPAPAPSGITACASRVADDPGNPVLARTMAAWLSGRPGR